MAEDGKEEAAGVDPTSLLFNEDAITGIPRVMGTLAEGVRPVLAIADPPYNIGQAYDAWDDAKSAEEYMTFSENWIRAAVDALAPSGSLWLAISDNFVSELDVLCKTKFKLRKRAAVVWYFTFGQHSARNFARSHVTWLYYSKMKTDYIFNAQDPVVRVPSARMAYKDKRANPAGRLPDDTWILRPEQLPEGFDALEDIWTFPRICGTFHAKVKGVSPNQMPVPMLERIIRLCSNPGDLIIDPFCGTGTAAVAAVRTGRRCIAFDLSAKCIDVAQVRVAQAVCAMTGQGPGSQQKLFADPQPGKEEVK